MNVFRFHKLMLPLFAHFNNHALQLQRFIRDFRFLNSQKESNQAAVGCTTLEEMVSHLHNVPEFIMSQCCENDDPPTDFVCLLDKLSISSEAIPEQ
jgi:hypothetical protein